MGDKSSFFSSFSIGFFCSIGAWVDSEIISFFDFSAAFLPKHDAHKPPVDFFIFFIGKLGNGPGLTNSISGKLTAAPCKSIVTGFFVTIISSCFVNGKIIDGFSGWT